MAHLGDFDSAVPKDAAPDAATPEAHARSSFARQHFNFLCVHRRDHADTQAAKVAFIVERARIAKIARWPQARGETNAVAVFELWKRREGFGLVFIPIARENCRTDSHRLCKCPVAEPDDFSSQIEAFPG